MTDRPKIAFGDLNPVEQPQIGKHYSVDSSSPLQAMKEAARNVFKIDALSNNGPFKGIVLRVDDPISGYDPSSWIATIFADEKPPLLRTVKVRIPEIHAMLPEPSRYGPNAGTSHKIIDLYPSFIAMTEEISNQPVAPGDIVLVDFANRENLSHPQYLGRVYETTLPGAVGLKSNEDVSKNAKSGVLNVEPPAGDEINGEKNLENQIPSLTEPQNRKSKFSQEDQNEIDHTDGTSFGLPKMDLIEEGFRNGNSLGFFELVEMKFPEQATKEGVFIAKKYLSFWVELVDAAKKDRIVLRLNSGFRSYAQQEYLYNNWKSGISGFNTAAKPGFSNHQDGTAFDIAGTEGGTSKIYLWLDKHAHKFGFVNSGKFFKKQQEFWHFEYIGNKK